MGINGINKLIKRHSTRAFFTLPITVLAGKRIAIDGNNWMYTTLAIARKKVVNSTDVAICEPDQNKILNEWFFICIRFLISWLVNDVTPVIIFDGKAPVEKDKTKQERNEQRIKSKNKIDELRELLKQDILIQPINLIEDLRRALRNYNNLSREDSELFKEVIRATGVPCLQAKEDGEQLCSSLCMEGRVSGVYSADTDNLTYGCPLIINSFSQNYNYDNDNNRIQQLECVRLDYVLSDLKIDHKTFVDLCIMSGCDFNTNIPKIGAIKSYNLLQKCGTIDNLPINLDKTCLNHIRCREIFSYKSSIELCENFNDSMLNINKNLDDSKELFNKVGVSSQINNLISIYHQMNSGTSCFFNSLSIPIKAVELNILDDDYIPAVSSTVKHNIVTLNIID